ncbi:MAG TPA: four helix bundle protein [Rhodospirillaceae bacterium]|nr:four helix bundle protein [Rhodospirillaceae bacterium]
MESHKNLDVWKKAIQLVTLVYSVTKKLPKEEMYGLTSQMRRAAVSIPSNIAEGRSKRTTKEYIRYANIAYGSASELETQLIIAGNLGYLEEGDVARALAELTDVAKMLYRLVCGLEKKLATP